MSLADAAADAARLRVLQQKRAAAAASAASAETKKARQREYQRQRRADAALETAVRAGGGGAESAWTELEARLRGRIAPGARVVVARTAAERLRALTPVAAPPPPPPPSPSLPGGAPPPRADALGPVKLVSFFDGLGGAEISLIEALVGTSLGVRVVHAADNHPGKLKLSAAVAQVSGALRAEPTRRADLADESIYTPEYVASWGHCDILSAGLPCVHHSQEGNRKGQADEPRGLRHPKCARLVQALLRVVSLMHTPRCLVLECSEKLIHDPFFASDLEQPLLKTFEIVTHVVVDSDRWLPMSRKRVFVLAFATAADYDAFGGVQLPPCRELKLEDAILSDDDGRVPASAWDAVKAQRRGNKLSVAAVAVSALKFVAGKDRSKISVFKRESLRTQRSAKGVGGAGASARGGSKKGRRAVVPRGLLHTLIKSPSGVWRVRTRRGTRSLVAAECGRIFGVPLRYINAMVAAASDCAVVSALGDGFAIPVVRDVFRALLRAFGFGI